MLDLVEGAKVIIAEQSTGGSVASGNVDWINMAHYHRIWALCTFSGTSGPVVETQVAEDYAGTSSSSQTDATQVWTCYDSTTLDRWTKSTALFGTLEDGNDGAVLMLFDPSCVSNSSNTHFSVANSSYVGALGVTYICEPRYGGYQQTIGTTSST